MPLAAYLTGAVGSTFLVSAPQAEAAVTSVTFGFGSVLSASSSYYNQHTSTTPGLGTIFAEGRTQNFYYFDWSAVRLGLDRNLGSFYHSHPGSSYGSASFLATGAIVGGGSNGPLGTAYFANSARSELEFTSDQLNKNIGFQTSSGNWGWANVSWNAAGKALTFNSAYVESVSGNTITVGDTGISAAPEPSRALLGLAGLAGVALRRRRKQVA